MAPMRESERETMKQPKTIECHTVNWLNWSYNNASGMVT